MPTPRKPDWADKTASAQPWMHESISIRVANLLRQEHTRAVRAVKQHQLAAHKRKWGNPVARLGYVVACADILAALKKGRA